MMVLCPHKDNKNKKKELTNPKEAKSSFNKKGGEKE